MEQNQVGYEDYENIDTKTLEKWQVDSYIKTVKENNEAIAKFKEIKDQHIRQLEEQFEEKKRIKSNENHFLLTTLGEFARLQKETKSTKTQLKYESLQGNVVIKKSVPKMNVPPKKNHEQIKEVFPELIETVETTKLAGWAEFKRDLVIQDGRTYRKSTGELLDEELFPITVNEEKIEVK